MKKLVALCLSLLLTLTLAAPAAAAGKDDGVKVQVNGRLVDFPDAAPEVVDGRTMVPLRAVLEALGAEVDYDAASQTTRAKLGGVSLSHAVGTDKIDISGGQALTMDTVSYVRRGSAMVPVRFFSQALGYEVYWDGGSRTAVVIDKKAAIAGIDKNFTISNTFRANQAADLSDGLDMDIKFSGSVRLLDSISGDRELPFSIEMRTLCTEKALNAWGKMDLSLLSELMTAVDEEAPQELKVLLKDLSFQIIYSGSSMWMELPALTEALRESGEELPAGEVWLKTAAIEAGALEELKALLTVAHAGTMGSALYAMAELADKDAPAQIYEDLTRAADLMAAIAGDETYAKSGEDYVWKMDQAMFGKVAEALGAFETSFPSAIEMTFKADGSSTFSLKMSMQQTPMAVTVTLTGSSSARSSSFEGRIQVKNVCDTTFQGTVTLTAPKKEPLTAPPADAAVVDLDAPSLLAA